MRPPVGRKSRSGSSAQIRASMAWPWKEMSDWVKARGSPAATRSCHSTRSSRPEPATATASSVTGCSTWRRVFISMKKKSRTPSVGVGESGSMPGTMNSTVPAPV